MQGIRYTTFGLAHSDRQKPRGQDSVSYTHCCRRNRYCNKSRSMGNRSSCCTHGAWQTCRLTSDADATVETPREAIQEFRQLAVQTQFIFMVFVSQCRGHPLKHGSTSLAHSAVFPRRAFLLVYSLFVAPSRFGARIRRTTRICDQRHDVSILHPYNAIDSCQVYQILAPQIAVVTCRQITEATHTL